MRVAQRSGLRLLVAACCLTLVADARAAERPNVLLILTDDQGWPTLGCYGGRVATPHLDRLAAEGVRFTDAYVTPQCTPTRASLLTGQHTARLGMWHVIAHRWYGYPYAPVAEPAYRMNLPRDAFTVAKGMRSAGYRTACLGKWHLTTNGDGGYVGLKPEAAKHYGFDYAPAPPEPRYHQRGDKGVDWLTDEAISFARADDDQPWFVYLAHHTVHGPLGAPDAAIAEQLAADAPAEGRDNATYLAMLTHLDASVGRLLSALDESGQRDDTLVVFLSDNGGVDTEYAIPLEETAKPEDAQPLATHQELYDNAPLRAGKGSMYEGGVRVPCLVRWPGHAEVGRVCDTPVHVVDWAPTLLAAAGARWPDDTMADGVDLAPLFVGDDLPQRDLYLFAPLYDLRWGATPSAWVRRGPWKLIRHYGDRFDAAGSYRPGSCVELFNLVNDPGETNDLAEAEPERAADMQARLDAWVRSFDAAPPGPNAAFDRDRALLEQYRPLTAADR